MNGDTEMAKRSESRQKITTIGVRCTPAEKDLLKHRAEAFDVSVGELCREAIFRSIPKSKTDQNAIGELATTRADLGRLGGLLKFWLSGDSAQPAPVPKTKTDVVKLLREVEAAQKLVVESVKKVSTKS